MLFPTISFAIFFFVIFSLYWLCITCVNLNGFSSWHSVANSLRKWILLLGSYVFYGFWDWRFLPLLIGSTLFNFFFARFLLGFQQRVDVAGRPKLGLSGGPSRPSASASGATELADSAAMDEARMRRLRLQMKWILIFSVAANLGILTFFKYTNWLLSNVNALLNQFELPIIFNQSTIILPLGISFFTFQNISFLVDVYRRKLHRTGSYLDYSLYIAFFPQLIAGPIVRANTILPQLQRLPNPQNIYLSDAFVRIFIGLVKKLFIANTLSTAFVDPVFLAPSAYSSWELLLAAYAYSAVIYCDFSAYSDMAVGLGLLCGIRLMENFDRPYASTSLQGFWRTWHISLSSWLRDYLYIPLGGSRRGNRYVNIILTMLLGGLWHGASWTFLLWGGLQGIAMSVEHFLRKGYKQRQQQSAKEARFGKRSYDNRRSGGLPQFLRGGCAWLYSFHFVTLSWILFRASNFEIAGTYFARLFSFSGFSGSSDFSASHISNIVVIAIIAGILPQMVLPKATKHMTRLLDSLPIIAQVAVFAVSVALLQVIIPEGVAPFIYYQF